MPRRKKEHVVDKGFQQDRSWSICYETHGEVYEGKAQGPGVWSQSAVEKLTLVLQAKYCVIIVTTKNNNYKRWHSYCRKGALKKCCDGGESDVGKFVANYQKNSDVFMWWTK